MNEHKEKTLDTREIVKQWLKTIPKEKRDKYKEVIDYQLELMRKSFFDRERLYDIYIYGVGKLTAYPMLLKSHLKKMHYKYKTEYISKEEFIQTIYKVVDYIEYKARTTKKMKIHRYYILCIMMLTAYDYIMPDDVKKRLYKIKEDYENYHDFEEYRWRDYYDIRRLEKKDNEKDT